LKREFMNGTLKVKFMDMKCMLISKAKYANSKGKKFLAVLVPEQTKSQFAKAWEIAQARYQSTFSLIKEKLAPIMAKIAVKADKIKAQMAKVLEQRIAALKQVVKPKIVALKQALEPKIVALQQSSVFKKVFCVACKGLQITVSGCEKAFGKEKTKALISKVEQCVPAVWKAAPVEKTVAEPVVVAPSSQR